MNLLKITFAALCFVLSSTAFAQQTFPIGPDSTLITRPQQPPIVCIRQVTGALICVGG